jgi:hypothetical protein
MAFIEKNKVRSAVSIVLFYGAERGTPGEDVAGAGRVIVDAG